MKWCKFYNKNLLVVLESKYIEMCFNNKYKYRTLHGGCYEIIKKQNKQKTKSKNSLVVLGSFSIFPAKILYMTK